MVFLGIILPVFLMTISPSVMALRGSIMAIGGLYLLYVIIKHRVQPHALGLTRRNFAPSVRALIIPTLLILPPIYFFLQGLPANQLNIWIGQDPQVIPSLTLRIILYVLLSVPVQELVFRGFIVWRIRSLYHSESLVFWLALLIFVYAHLPFYSPIMLVVAAYLGVLYTKNYLRYGNLYALILSHAVVGSLLIILRNYYLPY